MPLKNVSRATGSAPNAPSSRWVADRNASPPIFHELIIAGKQRALVRRVKGEWKVTKKGRRVYKHRFQVVRRFVDPIGGAVGPIFPSLTSAKRFAEGAAK